MKNTIDVASLKDFNPAHYLTDGETLKAYIQIIEDERNVDEFSDALTTAFLAIGANAVATNLGVNVEEVWSAQKRPSEHPATLQKIIVMIKEGLSSSNTTNPHSGSDFDDFLKEEGIYDEVTALAVRRVIAALLKRDL